VNTTSSVPLPDLHRQKLAAQRQDQLLKPQGALGRLEEVAVWFAARQNRVAPRQLVPAITVFVADHGVTAQRVSAYPASVTAEMLKSLAKGQAAIAVLAREINAIYTVVDVGIAGSPPTPPNAHCARIGNGTQDISLRAAMSPAQAQQALDTGAYYAAQVIAQGADLLIAGEVGIGNTTAAACLISALTQLEPDLVVGTGAGLDPAGRQHKLAVVQRALKRVQEQNCTPLQLLAELGGFEIGAMAGFYLHAARMGVPVLLDGFISAAAALLTCAMTPLSREWMLAAHQSAELGHTLALQQLQLKPLLNLGMRLGEGSGAAVAVPLIQAALRLHREMATFAEAGVSIASD
jgi:nicotinate-nucleotide--dimethylbenzimidazole phosphoribosyltransferase